jgi:hypothetical protein
MSIKLGAHKTDTTIFVFDPVYRYLVIRRFRMKDITWRLAWEVFDLLQLAIKDWLAKHEDASKVDVLKD